MSLDEQRVPFRPTLTNVQDEVTEIWFPGAHSDVGGGFRIDGLSDVALELMLAEGRKRALAFLRAEELPETLHGVDQNGDEVTIDREDVENRPDFRSKIHYQDPRSPALETRRVAVLRDDRASEHDLPLVHQTVARRIEAVAEYRPPALEDVPHLLVEADGSRRRCSGLRDHLAEG